MSFNIVNGYIMNMLETLQDDMNIADFKKLWLSKTEELKQLLESSVQAEPVSEPEITIRKKENGKLPSEYVLFCRMKREEVKASNPEMKGVDITRELARLWKLEKENRVKDINKEHQPELKPKNVRKQSLKKVVVTPTENGIDVTFEDTTKQKPKRNKVQKKQEEKQEETNIEKDKEVGKLKPKKRKVQKVQETEEDSGGYMKFCSENRAKIKAKYPEMNPIEVTKELAKEWKKQQLATRDEIRNIIGEAIGN